MCGIAGVWTARTDVNAVEIAAGMAGQLRHRGPDGDGVWSEPGTGFAMAHTRLAILDLSAAGAQPIASGSGHCVLVFNGEIYNHRELRAELAAAGVAFRGHCDAEVLVEACARWGLRDALGRLNGMFAFALWQRRERRLYLARDRIGEKPLYYGRAGRDFVFASELKAFMSLPAFARRVDPRAAASLMQFACIPAPYSVFAGIAIWLLASTIYNRWVPPVEIFLQMAVTALVFPLIAPLFMVLRRGMTTAPERL